MYQILLQYALKDFSGFFLLFFLLILPLCSINRYGGHDGWSTGSSDIILKGTPKDDSGQVWFKLAQWFQRRRFFKKFTDGRRMPIDGNSSYR